MSGIHVCAQEMAPSLPVLDEALVLDEEPTATVEAIGPELTAETAETPKRYVHVLLFYSLARTLLFCPSIDSTNSLSMGKYLPPCNASAPLWLSLMTPLGVPWSK